MAHFEDINKTDTVVLLSPKEAVDLIGLLAAQLAGVPLTVHQLGACPDIKLMDRGFCTKRDVDSAGPRSTVQNYPPGF